jgi:hypothetical protein
MQTELAEGVAFLFNPPKIRLYQTPRTPPRPAYR